MKSAVVVVTYNRPLALERLLGSLSRAKYDNSDQVDLIISCDHSGDKKTAKISENFLWNHGKKKVIAHSERLGLKKHILFCFEFAETYDFIFVLEDDLVVSDSFYFYGKQSSVFYYKCDKVAATSLYAYQKNWLNWSLRFEPEKTQYDAYFMRMGQSWGEVFTKKQWHSFKDWLSKNQEFIKDQDNPPLINTWPESSWLKFFIRYCILQDKYLVYPYHSLTTNCSDLGEHNKSLPVNDYQVDLISGQTEFHFQEFDNNNLECVKYDEYFNRVNLGSVLNVKDEELCADFWCTRSCLPKDSKYLLTSKKIKGLKIVDQYSLSFRPIEYSVINKIRNGGGLFLYSLDKHISLKPKCNSSLVVYSSRTHDFKYARILKRNLFSFRCKKIISRGLHFFKKK